MAYLESVTRGTVTSVIEYQGVGHPARIRLRCYFRLGLIPAYFYSFRV